MVFVFIEILFKMLLFKGGVLIYTEHCMCVYLYIQYTQHTYKNYVNKTFILDAINSFDSTNYNNNLAKI